MIDKVGGGESCLLSLCRTRRSGDPRVHARRNDGGSIRGKQGFLVWIVIVDFEKQLKRSQP